MKLALSNLALPSQPDAATWRGLRQAGIAGIEVAPTRVASWDELTVERLLSYRKALEDEGLQVSSLQALCYGVPGLSLLGDAEGFDRLVAHLRRVFGMARGLAAKACVFGSPGVRKRGNLTRDAAFAMALPRLQELGRIAEAEGAVLGLEPVPPFYGADFLETWQEVRSLVEAADTPGLRVHLDTGCVALGGGSIAEAVEACASLLCHFHVAEPELGPIAEPSLDHAGGAAALAAIGYQGWIAIEMRAPEPHNLHTLLRSVETAEGFYGRVAGGRAGARVEGA